MIYSVWNQAALAFDYFESPAQTKEASAPRPKHLRSCSTVGTHPEAAAWPLPSDARRVGSGPIPKGFVASRSSRSSGLGALGLLPFDLTGPNLVVLGVVAFLAYQHWWKDKP